jgi:putative endonuclease
VRPVVRQRRERAGRLAEATAALLLRLKGYRVLARRFTTPVGELDLVARRGDLVLFVEVKRRQVAGTALQALLPRQQRRIARAAAYYPALWSKLT